MGAQSAVSSASKPAGRSPGSSGKPERRPLALAAARIVQEAVKPDATIDALARLAAADPGFAVRVLAALNNAAYGLSRKVSDVRQGCALLGVRGLRNVALGLVVNDMAPSDASGTLLLTSSLRRAAAARLLAEAGGGIAADDAFTVGLVLDIGLLSRARHDMASVVEIVQTPAMSRPRLERALGSSPHDVVGGQLARELGLAEEMAAAIAGHHLRTAPTAPLARIGWAAERVAAVWEGGDLERLRADARAAARLVRVPDAAFDALLERLPTLVSESAALFQRSIAEQPRLDQLAQQAGAQLLELNNTYELMLRKLEALVEEKAALARELRRANEALATLAATDQLTGLPNKRAFDEALARDMGRASRGPVSLALVMMDVDFFKKVNDAHGHPTGDLVLEHVGRLLRSKVRAGDVAARYGGEEFALVLPDCDASGAARVADRIRVALEAATIHGKNGPVRVTASFGVASLRGPACVGGSTRLLERADAALYRSKDAGRNCVTVAD